MSFMIRQPYTLKEYLLSMKYLENLCNYNLELKLSKLDERTHISSCLLMNKDYISLSASNLEDICEVCLYNSSMLNKLTISYSDLNLVKVGHLLATLKGVKENSFSELIIRREIWPYPFKSNLNPFLILSPLLLKIGNLKFNSFLLGKVYENIQFHNKTLFRESRFIFFHLTSLIEEIKSYLLSLNSLKNDINLNSLLYREIHSNLEGIYDEFYQSVRTRGLIKRLYRTISWYLSFNHISEDKLLPLKLPYLKDGRFDFLSLNNGLHTYLSFLLIYDKNLRGDIYSTPQNNNVIVKIKKADGLLLSYIFNSNNYNNSFPLPMESELRDALSLWSDNSGDILFNFEEAVKTVKNL